MAATLIHLSGFSWQSPCCWRWLEARQRGLGGTVLCLKPTAARVALLVAPALLPVMAASLRPRFAGAVVQLGQL